MDIKLELLRRHISDYIECRLQDFEKYNLDASSRHDFGLLSLRTLFISKIYF